MTGPRFFEVTNLDGIIEVFAPAGFRIATIHPAERDRPPRRGFQIEGSDALYSTATGAVTAAIKGHQANRLKRP